MRYTALTSTGPFDIGEFPDQDTAEAWAAQRFGADLNAVMAEQSTTITVTADPSITTMALITGAVVLFGLTSLLKPRRKAR